MISFESVHPSTRLRVCVELLAARPPALSLTNQRGVVASPEWGAPMAETNTRHGTDTIRFTETRMHGARPRHEPVLPTMHNAHSTNRATSSSTEITPPGNAHTRAQLKGTAEELFSLGFVRNSLAAVLYYFHIPSREKETLRNSVQCQGWSYRNRVSDSVLSESRPPSALKFSKRTCGKLGRNRHFTW